MNFIKKTCLKWKYEKGKFISKFITHDIRKDLFVEDESEIHLGYLVVKERIFDARMLKNIDFQILHYSLPKKIAIEEIWSNPFTDLFKED